MSTNQTPPKSELITDEQEAKWKQILGDLLRKHGGNKKRAQRILGHPDFVPGIVELMNDCGIGNEFANEKVEPNTQFDYDIRTLPGTDEQIAKQMEAIELKDSGLLVVRHTTQETLHPDADGFGAVPSITDLGKIWGIDDPLGDGFGQVLERMLGFMKKHRGDKFHNYRAGELTKDHIRLFWLVREMWQKLEALVPAEEGKIRFFIIPMNFGKKYQGFSPRNARMDALDVDAMPLDPVSVTALLLGWPERQEKYENSVIDCSGAEYSWRADGEWSHVCYFFFYDGRL